MKLPKPGTEAFYQLGAEARKLARWRDNATALKEEQNQGKNLSDYMEA
ncbi:MAG: hypothetical protein ABEJ83_01925 [Candidatus Nanohaloarchaea archaeon]